jgi:hypothetical protein
LVGKKLNLDSFLSYLCSFKKSEIHQRSLNLDWPNVLICILSISKHRILSCSLSLVHTLLAPIST